jgi:hypothetical protein
VDAHVRAEAKMHPCGRECFIRGNFKKDATVHPSHGRAPAAIVRPSVHPSVRLSVIVRVTTLPCSRSFVCSSSSLL